MIFLFNDIINDKYIISPLTYILDFTMNLISEINNYVRGRTMHL